MSAAHTPGPWQLGATRIAVTTEGFDVWAIPVSGNGTAIGCVYSGLVGSRFNIDTNYSDAQLIAAAPDLLLALQTALFAVTRDADANDGRVDRIAVAEVCRAALKIAGAS